MEKFFQGPGIYMAIVVACLAIGVLMRRRRNVKAAKLAEEKLSAEIATANRENEAKLTFARESEAKRRSTLMALASEVRELLVLAKSDEEATLPHRAALGESLTSILKFAAVADISDHEIVKAEEYLLLTRTATEAKVRLAQIDAAQEAGVDAKIYHFNPKATFHVEDDEVEDTQLNLHPEHIVQENVVTATHDSSDDSDDEPTERFSRPLMDQAIATAHLNEENPNLVIEDEEIEAAFAEIRTATPSEEVVFVDENIKTLN